MGSCNFSFLRWANVGKHTSCGTDNRRGIDISYKKTISCWKNGPGPPRGRRGEVAPGPQLERGPQNFLSFEFLT